MPIDRDPSFFEKARKRFETASNFWKPIYDEMDTDLRFATGDQWDETVKTNRETVQGRPTLTFDVLHTNIQLVANQVRQNKPAIKINPVSHPGSQDEAKEVAKIKAGIIRHWNYASQGDIARDTAVKYAAAGGMGFYRVGKKYVVDDPDGDEEDVFNQDATIDWVRDPKTIFFDPGAIEQPDFSCADYCFVLKRMPWEDYTEEYGDRSPISWASWEQGNEDLGAWANEREVTVAEYWYVTKKRTTKKVNGKSREFEIRTVHQDFMNGIETISETTWEGKWIPIIPVLGEATVVEGKNKIASLIRYVRDAARLRNAYKSGIAENIGLTNRVPYTGPRGMFKSSDWATAHLKNPAYLEWDVVYDKNNQMIPAKPERQQLEAAIQALSEASAAEADDIKAGMGIYDSSLGAAKAEYSGVSVEKRTQQADVTNFHFADNLTRAMWHEGRILLDLMPYLIDTPRAMQIMDEDETISEALVTMAIEGDEDGHIRLVPGREGEPHHRMDQGRFSVTVTTGPTYSSQREEEYEQWMAFLAQAPELAPAFLPVILRWSNTPGADKLADVATAIAPPAAQAVLRGDEPIPAAAQAQIAQATQQLQALQAENMQLKFEKAAKTQELTMKHSTTIEQNTVDLLKAEIASKNKETIELVQQQFNAFEQMLQHNQELMLQHQAGVIKADPNMQAPAPPVDPNNLIPPSQPTNGAAA